MRKRAIKATSAAGSCERLGERVVNDAGILTTGLSLDRRAGACASHAVPPKPRRLPLVNYS